jgi:hypothetical protein
MANRTGLPYATPWKNYHLPFTELKVRKGLMTESISSTALTAYPPSIYINDDWVCKVPKSPDSYRMVFDAPISEPSDQGRVGYAGGEWRSNRYWFDGQEGSKNLWPAKGIGTTNGKGLMFARPMKYNPHTSSTDWNTKQAINVTAASTNILDGLDTVYVGRQLSEDFPQASLTKQEIVTIEPGLHIGFTKGMVTEGLGDGDTYEFTLDYDYIAQMAKEKRNTYSCWMWVPNEVDDFTYSDILPANLTKSNYTLCINPIRSGIKVVPDDTGYELGFHITIQGSVDGVIWDDVLHINNIADGIVALDYDLQLSEPYIYQLNLANSSGNAWKRLNYQRIKFQNLGQTANECSLQHAQYLMFTITKQQ